MHIETQTPRPIIPNGHRSRFLLNGAVEIHSNNGLRVGQTIPVYCFGAETAQAKVTEAMPHKPGHYMVKQVK